MRRAAHLALLCLLLQPIHDVAAGLTPYIRDVPYLSQRANKLNPSGTCQNTTLAIVLNYYGADTITPDMITRRWGTVANWNLAFDTLAEEHGLPLRAHGSLEGRASDIQRLVAEGRPVTIHGPFTDSGHLNVVLGYDGDYYYVHDPWGDFTTHYSNRDGRYVRIPASRMEGIMGEQIRYHVPESIEPPVFSVTQSSLPDSVVVGQRFRRGLSVHLQHPGHDAPRLTADLGALGGPTALELRRANDGSYRGESDFVITGPQHGIRQLVLRGETAGKTTERAWPVAVLPHEGLSLYDDGGLSGWYIMGAVFASSSDSAATDRVFSGQSSVRIEARSFGVSLRTETPVEAHGYDFLRFAFHPGDAEESSVLSVYINGDTRTIVHLMEDDEPQIDLTRREWQVVDVPMSAFTWLERPLESIHFQGTVNGSVHLDDISLVAARPSPVRASWEVTPIDSAIAGTTVTLEATVRILELAADGSHPQLVADLASLGAGEVQLDPQGDDVYRLHARVQLPEGNGSHTVEVSIVQDTPTGPEFFILEHLLVALPTANQVIFADEFVWEPSFVSKADLYVDDRGPVFSGSAALAVEANFFTVRLSAPDPIVPTGFEWLRFAFHPGTSSDSEPFISVSVNDDSRTAVLLTGEDPVVDLSRQEWQSVAIPIAHFGAFEGSIESIRFLGNLHGRFYLDDIQLVAARPAAAPTAVLTAEVVEVPAHSQLFPGYPNPFNAETLIRFDLDEGGIVELTVYNSAGQRIRTIARG
ncbi:MAG: hypothetical protein HOH74_12895, partial [Gemmatimonadetes bacterium]|nr:hypothetical protein [Gemmatimonadota bacterium]